jgi:hypothetical protein
MFDWKRTKKPDTFIYRQGILQNRRLSKSRSKNEGNYNEGGSKCLSTEEPNQLSCTIKLHIRWRGFRGYLDLPSLSHQSERS